MKASLGDLLARIPGPRTEKWPGGEPFTTAFGHGTMSVEVFAPRGTDNQTPHSQDEIYFVMSGTSDFIREGRRSVVQLGDAIFVPAGQKHHFEDMSKDFIAWVVFWGPQGGER